MNLNAIIRFRTFYVKALYAISFIIDGSVYNFISNHNLGIAYNLKLKSKKRYVVLERLKLLNTVANGYVLLKTDHRHYHELDI